MKQDCLDTPGQWIKLLYLLYILLNNENIVEGTYIV